MAKKANKTASKLTLGLALASMSWVINTGTANLSVLAQPVNEKKCDISAVVIDKDPQGLNVRSGPSSNSRILGKIPTYESVDIIASSGNWVKITNAFREIGGFQGTGWVFLPMLGTSTRGYETNGVNLYVSPSQQSRKIARVPRRTDVKLIGCQGEWAEIEYRGVKGWLKSDDQCGVGTTCS
ncbi:SH3 domain-containing protein [Coleofasciculus sp. FACHB-64]|uniref:SH3 domain-containing protein n=1 Tax=Cyanophyceae TaxID=3028117 RepID=UPI0016892BF3|nr:MULTISPECIES: SH3 domain-containing protein [unclassified Coleofasciculus]MBD1836911.1 SH3 domain-containing protein [Coleofasciculus sp. FACHB-501]MBD1897499.1 SH3 domain-containing protein [Coleofasciculus sp. FACHB-129]MBD2046849.1 SH3 domain-containing protein [Coleofasciculus sp. FACHB-64]